MICSVECFVRFIKEPPCRGTAQLGILSFSMAQFQGGRPGAIGTEDREFLQLTSLNLSEAQKTQRATYLQPGVVVQLHQNIQGGFKKGERYRVTQDATGEPQLTPLSGGPAKPIPYQHPDRFEAYAEKKLGLSVGDKIRFSLGGSSNDKQQRRISNGRVDEIAGFDKQGNLRLKSGMTVAKDYGHLALGYVVTSHSAQGKDERHVIAAMGSESLPAINARQLYVTASRGREDITLYVDNKAAVVQAIQNAGRQLSATELVGSAAVQRASQQRRQLRSHLRLIERAREWWRARVGGRDATPQRRQIPIHYQPAPHLGRS
ncbi:Multifunctional conjugation protein TraI [Botrimarina hoheduenensis]|uniref:Multifunctional conjugation protein TraI n=1 Tax=Botrimarina hoheduenensis TaxID=2528000 RepID=A0A5C5WG59_9BACT|nr:Multifunctional conjugation protein TraI [Botrimarina hoheduenensis]